MDVSWFHATWAGNKQQPCFFTHRKTTQRSTTIDFLQGGISLTFKDPRTLWVHLGRPGSSNWVRNPPYIYLQNWVVSFGGFHYRYIYTKNVPWDPMHGERNIHHLAIRFGSRGRVSEWVHVTSNSKVEGLDDIQGNRGIQAKGHELNHHGIVLTLGFQPPLKQY